MHTPGPWDFAADSYGKVRHSRKACVFATGKNATGAETMTTIASRIESWANARLIAAAPDLLAALRELIDHAAKYGGAPASADKMWGRVRAAIAKAEGR